MGKAGPDEGVGATASEEFGLEGSGRHLGPSNVGQIDMEFMLLIH